MDITTSVTPKLLARVFYVSRLYLRNIFFHSKERSQ